MIKNFQQFLANFFYVFHTHTHWEKKFPFHIFIWWLYRKNLRYIKFIHLKFMEKNILFISKFYTLFFDIFMNIETIIFWPEKYVCLFSWCFISGVQFFFTLQHQGFLHFHIRYLMSVIVDRYLMVCNYGKWKSWSHVIHNFCLSVKFCTM